MKLLSISSSASRPLTMADLRRRFAMVSREGLLGAVLVLVSIAAAGAIVFPAHQQRVLLQAQLDQQIAKANQPAVKAARATPAEQLIEFYQFFPSQSTVPQVLDKIYRAARVHGIQLEQGNYAPSQEKRARLLRYQITLPVKGSYVQLRKFVATVLAAVPIASLDNISFERQKIGDQLIEAKIKLTLYLDQQT